MDLTNLKDKRKIGGQDGKEKVCKLENEGRKYLPKR